MTDAVVIRDSVRKEARLGSLGVTSGPPTFEKLAPLKLVGAAVDQTMETVRAMVVTLGQVITGERSMKEMGGPLKIAQYSGQQASLGWIAFFWFMTVISINLGFINLLRSEDHTSELQSLIRISYAFFRLKKNNQNK